MKTTVATLQIAATARHGAEQTTTDAGTGMPRRQALCQALCQQRKCPRLHAVVTKLGREPPSGNENTSSLGQM